MELLHRDVESPTEGYGVEVLYVAWNHHHIVGRLVEHHQLTVAVVHQSSCRINCASQESVAIGYFFEVVVGYLEVEEADYVDYHN